MLGYFIIKNIVFFSALEDSGYMSSEGWEDM